jgi:hypothetical protein
MVFTHRTSQVRNPPIPDTDYILFITLVSKNLCAHGRTRTGTALRPTDFKSVAATNYATWAGRTLPVTLIILLLNNPSRTIQRMSIHTPIAKTIQNSLNLPVFGSGKGAFPFGVIIFLLIFSRHNKSFCVSF